MATIGSVYAKAVFELAKDKAHISQLLENLRAFSQLFDTHPSLSSVLSSGVVNPQKREAILNSILDSSELQPLAKRLLLLLSSKGRLANLSAVVQELEAMFEASQDIKSGQVKTAVELSQEELSVLGQALAKRIGGKVKLSQKVEPSLLGGVVATVGGRTFDASLRSQLEKFKSELI